MQINETNIILDKKPKGRDYESIEFNLKEVAEETGKQKQVKVKLNKNKKDYEFPKVNGKTITLNEIESINIIG